VELINCEQKDVSFGNRESYSVSEASVASTYIWLDKQVVVVQNCANHGHHGLQNKHIPDVLCDLVERKGMRLDPQFLTNSVLRILISYLLSNKLDEIG
jgi:hypothetical protein